MNKIISGTLPTSSAIIVTATLLGTMSLATSNSPNEDLFAKSIIYPRYSVNGTLDTYSNQKNVTMNALTITEVELRKLVDKMIESQVLQDVEFDNIIAINARKLYQHGFSA
jgi:hypothetical protein